MKNIFLLSMVLLGCNIATGNQKIQNEDIKSVADLIAVGSNSTHLPNDDKIYLKALSLNETLNAGIANGHIGGVRSSAAPTIMKIASAIITDTATITRQDGSWISSVSNPSAGNFTLNITAGTFASPGPTCNCTVSPTTGSGNDCFFTGSPTTSVVGVNTVNGPSTNLGFQIVCVGPSGP